MNENSPGGTGNNGKHDGNVKTGKTLVVAFGTTYDSVVGPFSRD